MKSIEKIINKFDIDVNPKKDHKILEEFQEVQAKSQHIKHDNFMIAIRRIIMKSPILKIAAMAIVVFACITGLTMLNKSTGVVLANVLTQIERIDTYMYEIDTTVQAQPAIVFGNIKTNEKILFSREYGRKRITDINDLTRGIVHQEEYLIPKDKVIIQILPGMKSYDRQKIDDDYMENIRNQSNDPERIIEKVLACKYNRLGISTIDSKKAEGFQTNDPNYDRGIYSSVDIKLWVDVKTQLPVLMQMDALNEGQINAKRSVIVHNFQWNIPVNVSDFKPVIPDDYTPMGTMKMPANTEESAIKGLKLFTDLFGSYPKELDMVILTRKTMTEISDSNTPAAKQFQEELKGLSPEEIGQKQMDATILILGPAYFYAQLVIDNKEPAYNGDKVALGDANQVLLRWKISDNEFRVIYGDLHAETVTKEKLAEIEAALPK
jgi:hypothetical protein